MRDVPEETSWDGLSDSYLALWEAAGRPPEDGMARWAKVLQRTSATRHTPVSSTGPWNEEAYLAEVKVRYGSDVVGVCRNLIRWARGHADDVEWSKKSKFGCMHVVVQSAHAKKRLFEPWIATNGGVMIDLSALQSGTPFAAQGLRSELIERLNRIPDASLDPKNLAGWPTIPYSALLTPESRDVFFAAFEWAADLIRRG